jgi:hypothetical protein
MNTRECLAMLLRSGNVGLNAFTDHEEVLAAAIRQGPGPAPAQGPHPRRRGRASHDLIGHLLLRGGVERAGPGAAGERQYSER